MSSQLTKFWEELGLYKSLMINRLTTVLALYNKEIPYGQINIIFTWLGWNASTFLCQHCIPNIIFVFTRARVTSLHYYGVTVSNKNLIVLYCKNISSCPKLISKLTASTLMQTLLTYTTYQYHSKTRVSLCEKISHFWQQVRDLLFYEIN